MADAVKTVPGRGQYAFRIRNQWIGGLPQSLPARRIQIAVEADFDLRAFLGLDPAAPGASAQIRVNYRIKVNVSDRQPEESAAWARDTRRSSPRLPQVPLSPSMCAA